MTHKKLISAVLIPVLSVVLFFTVVEFSTRLISWMTGNGFTLAFHEIDANDNAMKHIYQWHPFVGYVFRPLNRFEAGHPNQDSKAVIFVDRHGFLARDDTLTRSKPADEIRLAFIGGSTTACLNLPFEKNWPGRVAAMVERAMPGKTVRAINAGIPGFDTAMSIGNLALRVLPFSPDVVVIYHAYNDLKAIGGKTPFQPDYANLHSHPFGCGPEPNAMVQLLHRSMAYVRVRNQYRRYRRKVAFEKGLVKDGGDGGRLDKIPQEAVDAFSQHIRSMVAISQSCGARVILLSFATLHNLSLDLNSAATFRRLSKRKKVELVAMAQFIPGLTIQAIFDGLRRYNQTLRQIAADEHTGWLDAAHHIAHDERFFVDRVHFSSEGAREMARHLAPVVLACLKEKSPTRKEAGAPGK